MICSSVCLLREGGRLPDEGSGSAARLLRLLSRALGPSTYIKPDRERVRDGAASNGADGRSPVGEDRQAHGLQTGQRRGKNTATIEGRKSVAQSRPRRQIPKWPSRSSKCRHTTPPDRSRHPISCIAHDSSEPLLRNPIIGMAKYCARAAIGHAAATPRPAMNSRLFIRSPRRP